MKKLLSCYLFFWVLQIQLFSQNLTISETVEYINKKFVDYPVRNTLSHEYLETYQLSLIGDYITITQNNKDITAGTSMRATYKVRSPNLLSNAYINKNRKGDNSLCIQIDCKNGSNNVESNFSSTDFTKKSFYSYISVNIGTNEENAQYLCNAFNHLIDLLNESSNTSTTDPFADYRKKQIETNQKTPARNLPATENKLPPKSSNISYKSFIYRYTITLPNKFKKVSAQGKNIDMKFITDDGTSILINVSPRLREEYSISAHDYSKEFFENSFKQNNLKMPILETEKFYFAGYKAFKMISYNPLNTNLKVYEIYFFRNTYAYVLTATTSSRLYNDYEKIFNEVFDSCNQKLTMYSFR